MMPLMYHASIQNSRCSLNFNRWKRLQKMQICMEEQKQFSETEIVSSLRAGALVRKISDHGQVQQNGLLPVSIHFQFTVCLIIFLWFRRLLIEHFCFNLMFSSNRSTIVLLFGKQSRRHFAESLFVLS